MRPLIIVAVVIACSSVFGSDIREFDLKTVERLGNELARLSDTPEKGATSPARKRARETAIAALKGKLFDISYNQMAGGAATLSTSSPKSCAGC
jgi:hypothetical protein